MSIKFNMLPGNDKFSRHFGHKQKKMKTKKYKPNPLVQANLYRSRVKLHRKMSQKQLIFAFIIDPARAI